MLGGKSWTWDAGIEPVPRRATAQQHAVVKLPTMHATLAPAPHRMFYKGESAQLMRMKELAVVGATLVAAARSIPAAGGSSIVNTSNGTNTRSGSSSSGGTSRNGSTASLSAAAAAAAASSRAAASAAAAGDSCNASDYDSGCGSGTDGGNMTPRLSSPLARGAGHSSSSSAAWPQHRRPSAGGVLYCSWGHVVDTRFGDGEGAVGRIRVLLAMTREAHHIATAWRPSKSTEAHARDLRRGGWRQDSPTPGAGGFCGAAAAHAHSPPPALASSGHKLPPPPPSLPRSPSVRAPLPQLGSEAPLPEPQPLSDAGGEHASDYLDAEAEEEGEPPRGRRGPSSRHHYQHPSRGVRGAGPARGRLGGLAGALMSGRWALLQAGLGLMAPLFLYYGCVQVRLAVVGGWWLWQAAVVAGTPELCVHSLAEMPHDLSKLQTCPCPSPALLLTFLPPHAPAHAHTHLPIPTRPRAGSHSHTLAHPLTHSHTLPHTLKLSHTHAARRWSTCATCRTRAVWAARCASWWATRTAGCRPGTAASTPSGCQASSQWRCPTSQAWGRRYGGYVRCRGAYAGEGMAEEFAGRRSAEEGTSTGGSSEEMWVGPQDCVRAVMLCDHDTGHCPRPCCYPLHRLLPSPLWTRP